MAAAAELSDQIRILVADDQGVIRMGLAMILDHEPDLTTVAQAGDGEEALRMVDQYDPDVVLMDIRMPVMDGLVATERITAANKAAGRSKPAVLVLTTFDDEAYVLSAVRAGASGFLLKDMAAEDIASAVRQVARGADALLAPAVTRRLVDRYTAARPKPTGHGLDDLTPRELEVLTLVARGLSNAEIATDLFISETTVKTHVARMLMKLGLRDRVQAVVVAYELGVAGG
jgi:DNA-binding NarL/FixJ family response regulator